MTIECLNAVSDLMEKLSIPYAFKEWKGKVPKTYFVGDYNEVPLLTTEESGESETTFMLDGFTRDQWLSLERYKEIIKKALPLRAVTESGSVIAFFYENSNPIETGDAEIKRIQIILRVKEWGY